MLPLLIVSFHRSGSSMTAQLLHAAGMHLGDELLGARPSNPYGHFEDTEVIGFHDELLANDGHAWYLEKGIVSNMQLPAVRWISRYVARKAASHAAYGVKDPRLCLTIRHWHAALGRVRILFVHRGARASCASFWHRAVVDLRAQRGLAVNTKLAECPDRIARIYIHNICSFLSFYQSLPDCREQVMFVAYDDLLSGRDIIAELRARWDLPLRDIAIGEIFDAEAGMVGSSLRLSSISRDLQDRIDDLDHLLTERCQGTA